MDKVGCFIGNIFVNGENIAISLLERGLASIHDFSANESSYSGQLYGAERRARDEKKGLWKNYDEGAEKAAEEEEQAAQVVVEPRREYIDLVISEYLSGHRFFVQIINEDVRKLETLMHELSQYHTSRGGMDGPHKPRVGDLVSAKFTEDDSWYRAKVRKVTGTNVEVFYIDYGNVSIFTRLLNIHSEYSSLMNSCSLKSCQHPVLECFQINSSH